MTENLKTPWADRLSHADYQPSKKHWLVTAITKWAYRHNPRTNLSPLVYGTTDNVFIAASHFRWT